MAVDDAASDDAAPADNYDIDEEEEADAFPVSSGVGTGGIMIDRDSMAMLSSNQNPFSSNVPSVANSASVTELASLVGSTVGMPKEAFLKSITFFKEQVDTSDTGWGIQLSDRIGSFKGFRGLGKRKTNRVFVDSVSGFMALSKIEEGDYLKTINGQSVGSSVNAERALQRMHNALDQDGYLHLTVKNREQYTDDILIHITVVKPDPDMKYEDMGAVVWFWGYLCVKSIKEDSVLSKTALRETDHIVSVNDISCQGLEVEQFKEIIDALPFELTFTVLRRKQRISGKFG